MAASDWNTVTSDLQRAVNNLAWFVLESMTLPEQAHFMVPLPLDSLSTQPLPVVPSSIQPHQPLQSPAHSSPDESSAVPFLFMPSSRVPKAAHKKKGPSKRQQKQQQEQQQQQQQPQSNSDAGAALDCLVAETLA